MTTHQGASMRGETSRTPLRRPRGARTIALVFALVCLPGTGAQLQAGGRQAPLPSKTPVPLVGDATAAEVALAAAREAGTGLVADLALGHRGQLVVAEPAIALPPGRYRLHALVASTPHDHILVEAVALRLSAGKISATMERRDRFRTPGELSHVYLDFIAAKGEPTEIRFAWFVGDTALDRNRYRDLGKARQAYRAQRQDAINQYALKHQTSEGADVGDDEAGDEDLGDEFEEEEEPRLAPRPLNQQGLPAYRLLLAGMVIEPLTPVSVIAVETDKPAYGAGESGKVTAELHNRSSAPAKVELQWSVTDDGAPQQALATGKESLSLQGGQKLSHAFDEPFPTKEVAVVGRLTVSVSVGGLRANRESAPFVRLPPRRKPPARDKRIFSHYMGCWPIAYGPLPYGRSTEGKYLKHESKDPKISRGGHVRNYALGPPDLKLTPEQSAGLEIRRALRIGIDGFAIDAWAGDKDAKRSFDALICTAAAKDYPFEVTVCVDPACGGRLDSTVKWLVERYGDNPKLARRDGKPLIFGYFSQGPAWSFAQAKAGAKTDAEKIALRSSPLGWHLAGAAFREAERRVGQAVFYQFGYGYLFHPYLKEIPDKKSVEALGTIARYVDAVGTFGFPGRHAQEIAAAVKKSGAEWSGGIGMYQKENIPFELYIPPGTEWLEGKWRGIRNQGATLPQFITWNDYGENSNVAPAWETRYTLYDLTGYHIEWWKTGKQPEVKRDRVYLIYAKYPRGAKIWPFAQGWTRPRKLEVLTILHAAATICLPGREIEFEAPAGYSRKQFPLTVGPVIAEVVRGGEVVTRIESPEPITDRPFRESNGMICFSTEFMRHWKEDFGEAKPFLYGEYADDDRDGLPNWFEMYWFTKERGFKPMRKATLEEEIAEEEVKATHTKWLDFSTMTSIDPKADPDGDGKTNLQEYLDRTDPTVGVPQGAAMDPDDVGDL